MENVQSPHPSETSANRLAFTQHEDIREEVRICIERLRLGRHSNAQLLVGTYDAGKSAMLDRLHRDIEHLGAMTICIPMPGSCKLSDQLVPLIHMVLTRLSKVPAARDEVALGLNELARFVHRMKVPYGEIDGAYLDSFELALPFFGRLEVDLCALLAQVGLAAQAAKSVLAIVIDDMHLMSRYEKVSLLYALHRCNQKGLPVTVIGTGLPEILGQLSEATGYAERMFEVTYLSPLNDMDFSVQA